jgi:hypothetical protein
MRTLIVGDVHGCAEELISLLRAARADRVVFVGDLYTKGPDPAGVWRAVRASGGASVLGNHDARLLDVLDGRRADDEAARRTVAQLDAEDRGWRDHLRALPLFLEVGPYTVVHAGLHPTGDLAQTPPRMAISMRRFPGTGRRDPWWGDVYVGARRVVYGHDAKRGLVRRCRDGVPWLYGLDTGCVYGGQLTGLIVEEDRLIQAPARAVWHAVGRGEA